MRFNTLGKLISGGLILAVALCAVAGEPTSARVQQRPAVKPFAVYDANGKFVGPFYPPNYAQMAIGSKRYAVELWSQSGLGTEVQLAPSVMHFTTTDCSGDPHVRVDEHPIATMPRAFMEVVGGKVSLYPAASLSFIDMRSLRSGGFCGENFANGLPVYSLGEPLDITNLYTPTLRVK